MNAIHYRTYINLSRVLQIVLTNCSGVYISGPIGVFEVPSFLLMFGTHSTKTTEIESKNVRGEDYIKLFTGQIEA